MFGSLINRLMERPAAPAIETTPTDSPRQQAEQARLERIRAAAPALGDGATILGYSDRYAATVVAVYLGGTGSVIVQRDTVTVDTESAAYLAGHRPGNSEFYAYLYAPNPDAAREVFTLRKNGRWVKQGQPMNGGTGIAFGQRAEYRDPSF